MLLALGAASAALEALTSFVAQKPSSSQAATGFNQKSAFNVTDPTSTGSASTPGTGSSPQSGRLSPATMSALLAAQGQSPTVASTPARPTDALKSLFAQLDADGDGKIGKSEFENALGAGGTNVAQADNVFSKMDRDSDGSVSLDEMSSALKSHHHRHANPALGATNDVSASAASAYGAIEQAKQRQTQAVVSLAGVVDFGQRVAVSLTETILPRR